MALPTLVGGIWPEHPMPLSTGLSHPALVTTQPPAGLKGTNLPGDATPSGLLGKQSLGEPKPHFWRPQVPSLAAEAQAQATPAPSPWEFAPLLGDARGCQGSRRTPSPKHTRVDQTCPPCTQAGLSPGPHIAPRRAPAHPLNRPLSWPALPRLGQLECIWTSQNVFSFMRIMPGPLSWVQGSTKKALSPFSQVQRTERRGQC